MMGIQAVPFATAVVLGGISLMVLIFIRGFVSGRKRSVGGLPPVPGTTGFFIFYFLFFRSVSYVNLLILMLMLMNNGFCLTRVAEIPGLPLIGNLLQLKEKKPHKTFAKWAETYGPIFSIRTGASTLIVLNSAEVVKEVGFYSLSLSLSLLCYRIIGPSPP